MVFFNILRSAIVKGCCIVVLPWACGLYHPILITLNLVEVELNNLVFYVQTQTDDQTGDNTRSHTRDQTKNKSVIDDGKNGQLLRIGFQCRIGL